MELVELSHKRGIYSFYNGSIYMIYSQYYGLVAFSDKIEREESTVNIDFLICNWYGYWDLKSIITRGINKIENRYINKTVKITYNSLPKTDNSLENIAYIDFKLKFR